MKSSILASLQLKNYLFTQSSAIEDVGLIPGLERSPGDGNGNPPPVFLPGESHGQRSLAGSTLQDCKESDTTEATEHAHSVPVTHTAGSLIFREKPAPTVGVPNDGGVLVIVNLCAPQVRPERCELLKMSHELQ